MTDTNKMLQDEVQRIADELESLKDDSFYYDEGDHEGENFFDDYYDIEYTFDLSGFIGVRVMVACGGPYIFVNSNNWTVQGDWGDDKAECPLSMKCADAITEYFREFAMSFIDTLVNGNR